MWKFNARPESEDYDPDKLAYYFFQALAVVNYLHERNVYHGAIRPAAFEIFSNQRVKTSEFNFALKLNPSFPDTQESYQLKHLPYFCKDEVARKFNSGGKFSKRELVEIDRHALLKTFE